MPDGALGIWYAKDYVATPRKAIKNTVAGGTPSANLVAAATNFPQAMFSLTSATETRRNITGWTSGITSASRIVGTGNYKAGMPLTLPAGTYTLAADYKSNTSTTSFTMSLSSGENTATLSATTSWQRLTMQFTISSAGGRFIYWMGSPDGTTGCDIAIDNVCLFAGSSDLGAEAPVGHAYFDFDSFVTGKTSNPATGVVDVSSSGSAIIQFPSQTLTAFTVGAMVKRTAGANGNNLTAILSSPVLGLNTFAQYISLGINSCQGTVASTSTRFKGPWDNTGDGWRLISHQYDGSTYSIWVDDHCMFRKVVSNKTATLDALLAFSVTSLGAASTAHQMNSMFVYPTALSDSAMRNQVYPALAARLIADGQSLPSTTRIVVAEGDSITFDDVASNPYWNQFFANAAATTWGSTYAQNSADINTAAGGNTLVDRAPLVDVAVGRSGKHILTVLIGANDLYSTSGATDAIAAQNWCDKLFAYTSARRAAGWTVAVGTLLPFGSGSGQQAVHNARRAVANPLIRAAVGTYIDAVIDYDTDAQMGVDNSFTLYPSNWIDSVHPSNAGQTRLEPIYRAVVNAL